MKKIVAIAMLVFSCQGLYAQYVDTIIKYYDFDFNITDAGSKDYYYFTIAKRTIDGFWHAKNYYAENKALESEGLFLDECLDIADGKHYTYYKNGQIKLDCSFKENKAVGKWLYYNKHGRLLDSLRYRNTGIPYYKNYSWDDSGHLVYYGDFDIQGSGAGYETEYYANGVVSSFGKFTSGLVKDSIWTYYYENGKVSAVETYDSGRLLTNQCYTISGDVQEECDTSFLDVNSGYNVGFYLHKKYRDLGLYDLFKKYNLNGEWNFYIKLNTDKYGKSDIEMIDEFPEEIYRLLREIYQSLPALKPAMYKNRPLEVSEEIILPFNRKYSLNMRSSGWQIE